MITEDIIGAATREARQIAESKPADALRSLLEQNSDNVIYTLQWNAESLLAYAHRHAFATELCEALDHDETRTVESAGKIIGEWTDMLIKVCLRAAASPGRSTSPMSNLNDSVKAKAAAELLVFITFRPFAKVHAY